MTGSDRRSAIVEQIRNSAVPISGKALAAAFNVSRQVIVQDIALIRAAGHDIISTNRGYIINEPHSARRVFKVRHTDEQLEEEHCLDRLELPFHKALAAGQLPLTMGGGIGQSRLSMYLLEKLHIGEVQVSVWDEKTYSYCRANGIQLM